jgi:lipopolysaccharide/colanic/teichoic acid biosynthesis glycosyltransferase
MALGSLTLVLVLGWQDIYHQNVLLRSRWISSKIAKAVLIWTAGFLAITLALKLQPSISRVYVMLNGATALLLLLGWRVLFLNFLRTPGRVEALRQRALFVGWNDEALSLWKTLKRDHACSGLTLETIAGTPVLGVTRLPLDGTLNVIAKRALDIAGATVGLLVSAPIVALFSSMVWLESRGPVFYRQRRWGVNGVPFDIIKIRSMKLNAEQSSGAQWCVKDDPRRLRVGAFMRKWNIDELPQFWNVLKGEMSLVGPRPERPELIASFKHQIPHYNARHHSKPGMTGWAQVNGLRGDTDLSERIQCDLWYLENWSLWLDLQIMLLTFFKRDNAY